MLPIPERIRTRRLKLGLTAAQLAEKAGVSATYISLIETGRRVPSDEAAAALARALGDEEDLYRRWAFAERHRGNPYASAVDSLPDAATRRALAHGVPLDDLALHATVAASSPPQRPEAYDSIATRSDAEPRSAAHPPEPVLVPVLPAGSDPRAAAEPGRAIRQLVLDASLAGPDPARLFAYEVDRALALDWSDVSPGDVLVFTRRFRRIGDDRVYVVRVRSRGPAAEGPWQLVVRRVRFRDRALVLIKPRGSTDIDVEPLGPREDPLGRLEGRLVLTIRRSG